MKQPIEEPALYRAMIAVKPANLTLNAWLKLAGLNRNFFQDLRVNGQARHDSIKKLLDAIDVSLAEFDAKLGGRKIVEKSTLSGLRDLRSASRDQALPLDVPVLGSGEAADLEVDEKGRATPVKRQEIETDQVVAWLRRPPAIHGRPDVYALYIHGDSMEPRFRHGEAVYVDPRRPASIGDDVVVQLTEPDGDGEPAIVQALIKQLVRRDSARIELRQYNPAITFKLDRTRVAAIHRIVPWGELLS